MKSSKIQLNEIALKMLGEIPVWGKLAVQRYRENPLEIDDDFWTYRKTGRDVLYQLPGC